MGGTWEWQIRSAWTILEALLKTHGSSLNDENVIGLDQWFADIKKMCQYLRFKGTLMQI